MNMIGDRMPEPPNPYRIHLLGVGILGFVGLASLQYSGWQPIRDNLLPFIIGLLALTIAFIFGFGVMFGWVGFKKRFGGSRLLAFWEIDGENWESYLQKRKSIGSGKVVLMCVVIPLIVTGTMLVLGYSDGELAEVLPVALAVGGGMAVLMLTMVIFNRLSLRGKTGRVWLAEGGVMLNGQVFFSETYGVTLLDCGLMEGNGISELSIRYSVRSGRTVAEHEMLVPVPVTHTDLVRETIGKWLAKRH